MAAATFAIPSFLGGEISQFAQGRFDRPDYRISLNVCLNAFPVEIGAWVRRPGTQYGGHSRAGLPGRVIKFDFEQATPYTIEFTDGRLRFRSGADLIATNDTQTVLAVSTANPAVVRVASAANWVSGNTLIFSSPGPAPMLEKRQFTATKVDTTHFAIADALTGATIDGSTLGAISAGATVSRVQELTTPYTGGSWSSIRAVQAETTTILLQAEVPLQALTVTTEPSAGVNAVFAINPATLNDGPYLDPFTNGVLATAGAQSGIFSLELSFPIYSSTTAYAKGSFVTASSINYISLVDQNVGNTPASSPAFWATTSAGAAIGPNGFQASDIGRLVRLLSEPAAWNSGSTYAQGVNVSYNPSNEPGAAVYYSSLTAGNNGNVPGENTTSWAIVPQGAAIWTWGKIVSLSNGIDRNLSGSLAIGDLIQGGALASAFDGNFSKALSASASTTKTASFAIPAGTLFNINGYVGKNFIGSGPQKIQQVTVFPTNDQFFGDGTYVDNATGNTLALVMSGTQLILFASQTPPAFGSDGTQLGIATGVGGLSAITIVSSDQATAWNYVWVQLGTNGTVQTAARSYQLGAGIAQLSMFNPSGTGITTGVNIELLGAALPYATPIATWRMGAYTTNTYPTCGTYFEGRIWLGGAIPNRFDACKSNGIVGGTINFAPTDIYGVVSGDSALDYTLNSDSVNPIFWFEPDLQGVIIGTQAGEYLVQAPTAGPITATNIAARRVTKIGCANVEPRRTDHTAVFVQRYGQKLMEYFADVFSGKFSAPNLAEKAQHLTSPGIAEMAYCSAVTPLLWGRCNDGSWFGMSYKRDTLTTSQGPTFAAWHAHTLGSGRDVESICSGPSVGGGLDSLTMVTNDPATGIRHVEVLTDTQGETTALTSLWLLDDAVAPSSFSVNPTPVTGAPFGGVTFNGLWHLNGKTVQVFAGGLDCGNIGDNKQTYRDFAVANGSVFVPFGDGTSAGSGAGLFTQAYFASFNGACPVVIGCTYNSDGQMVRPIMPADTGARTGPALGLLRRIHRYAMLLVNSRGISVGTNFSKLNPVNFRQYAKSLGTLEMFSGVAQDSLQDDSSYESMLCWRASRPDSPANVAAISGNIQAQDQ